MENKGKDMVVLLEYNPNQEVKWNYNYKNEDGSWHREPDTSGWSSIAYTNEVYARLFCNFFDEVVKVNSLKESVTLVKKYWVFYNTMMSVLFSSGVKDGYDPLSYEQSNFYAIGKNANND